MKKKLTKLDQLIEAVADAGTNRGLGSEQNTRPEQDREDEEAVEKAKQQLRRYVNRIVAAAKRKKS